jgi:hypothetical protein
MIEVDMVTLTTPTQVPLEGCLKGIQSPRPLVKPSLRSDLPERTIIIDQLIVRTILSKHLVINMLIVRQNLRLLLIQEPKVLVRALTDK